MAAFDNRSKGPRDRKEKEEEEEEEASLDTEQIKTAPPSVRRATKY